MAAVQSQGAERFFFHFSPDKMVTCEAENTAVVCVLKIWGLNLSEEKII